jgi:hypothetical protein
MGRGLETAGGIADRAAAPSWNQGAGRGGESLIHETNIRSHLEQIKNNIGIRQRICDKLQEWQGKPARS